MMRAMPVASTPSHISIACVLQAMADGAVFRIELPLSPPWRPFAIVDVTNTHGLAIDPSSVYALIVSAGCGARDLLKTSHHARFHPPTRPLQPDYNNGRLHQMDAASTEEVLLSITFPMSSSGIAIDPTGAYAVRVRCCKCLSTTVNSPRKQVAILYTGGLYTYALPRSGTATTTQGPSSTQTLSTGSSPTQTLTRSSTASRTCTSSQSSTASDSGSPSVRATPSQTASFTPSASQTATVSAIPVQLQLGSELAIFSAAAQNFTAPPGGCFVTAILSGGGGGNAMTAVGGGAANFSVAFWLPEGVIMSTSVGAGGTGGILDGTGRRHRAPVVAVTLVSRLSTTPRLGLA